MKALALACLLLGLAACTAPGTRPATSGAPAAAAPKGELYIDGLVTPPPADPRSLEERDLERIGRKP